MSDEVALAVALGSALVSLVAAAFSSHYAWRSKISAERARVSENVCSNLADNAAAKTAAANVRPAWPQGY